MERLENQDGKGVILDFITKEIDACFRTNLPHSITKADIVEGMKEGWNGMMKCVNCDLDKHLGKYLS